MTSIMQILTGLPPAAAVLVKATALLAIGCLLSFVLSRRNPRWRVLVWRLAMAGLILIAPAEWLLPKLRLTVEAPPTPISAVSPAPGDPAMPAAARPVEVHAFETSAPALPAPPPSLVQTIAGHPLEIAVAIWLIAVILIAARSAYVVLRVRRLVRSATPAPDAIRHMGRSIAEALGCRAPDVRLTKDLLSPFVAGIARPVVVVPALLTEAGRRGDLPAILAHELAHIRSRDLAWMALARWISILLWFHPLAWWMRRAHSAACEEVSDGVAAEHAGGAPAYSRALASTFLELVVDAPHPIGVPMIRPSEIMQRIRSLKRGIEARRLTRKKIVTCSIAVIVLVTVLARIQFVHAETPTPAQGTVDVILQLEGKTVRGEPKIAPAEKPFDALYEKTAAHFDLREIENGRWAVSLPEGQQFVIGWLAGKRMFGYISEPFEARSGRIVSFSPGMPATFEYDLSNPPDGIPCFPASVNLMKKTGDTYLNWGGRRELKKPGVVKIENIAGGEWMIDVQKSDRKSDEARLPFLWDQRAVTIRPGQVNRFKVIGPVIDRTVEAGDVTIRGKLMGADGKGAAGQKILLIPIEGRSRPNLRSVSFTHFYPAQTTGTDGSFEFIGVDPSYFYQVEHSNGKQESCHSLKPSELREKTIEIGMQVGKSTDGIQPLPAASRITSQGRVITFPSDQVVGQIQIRDIARSGDWQEGWEKLGDALGAVQIPAGKSVALFVDEEAGKYLKFLESLKPDDVQFLSIASRFTLDSDLKSIKHLTGLKALSLQGCTIDGSGFDQLRGLNQLEELRLGNHGQPLKDESMAQLGRLTSLRWLALWGTGISDAGVENLRPLTQLRSLMLGNTKITDKSLEVVKGFDRLESLQLENTLITDDGLANLSALTRLKHVKLGRNNITDEGMEHIKGLTNLENVWIDNDPITDRGLACLAGMKNLKELYADGTQITDAGLAALKPMKSFEHLLIGGTGDAGLAELRDLPSLNMLQIQSSRVTRAGIPSLKQMRSLKKLFISGDNVDAKFIADLKAALPACDVSDPNHRPDEPQEDLSWKARFDSVYRLDDGQKLKRIGKPFIPERFRYFAYHNERQARNIPEGPDMMVFRWDGSLKRNARHYGEVKLKHALESMINWQNVDYEGAKDILELRESSDWIADSEASTADLLNEFGRIVTEITGRKLRIEKKTVERDVIVARGQYEFHRDQNAPINGVFLYIDKLTNEDGSGGGAGKFKEFLDWIGGHVRIRVIDETQTDPSTQVSWSNCTDSHLNKIGNDPAKIDRLLKNLSRQTSLEFKRERRPVEIWFISEETPSAGAAPVARTDSRAERIARSRAAIEQAVRQRSAPPRQ